MVGWNDFCIPDHDGDGDDDVDDDDNDGDVCQLLSKGFPKATVIK